MSIVLDDVTYRYSTEQSHTDGLTHFSTTIQDGDFVGVMGRTGSGKSTLLRLIDALITPQSGTISIDNLDINGRNKNSYSRQLLRRRVGFVFQFPENQIFETTVYREVTFGMRHLGFSKAEIEQNAQDILQRFGFNYEAIKDISPLGLSGGQKRRVALASVLAAHPQILLLDEPIAGLDPLGREKFLNFLTELNQSGMTIIMVSHNSDAICMCTRHLLILDHGMKVFDGVTSDAFSDSQELMQYGIFPSQSSQLAYTLRQSGIQLPTNIIEPSSLFTSVANVMRQRGEK
ncbi:MAG: energy-coupling factor transporter ATPase [Aeriscardovia sp.]|nr:energy-coupling factor transporter ATPase [Aeriscardovia sp.]